MDDFFVFFEEIRKQGLQFCHKCGIMEYNILHIISVPEGRLIMEKKKVGIIGATGMVGQRFLTLLDGHPYFEVTALAASARSAGQTYEKAVEGRWKMAVPIPAAV